MNWIMEELVGADDAPEYELLEVKSGTFASTTGPWGGAGGQMVTSLTMTIAQNWVRGELHVWCERTWLGYVEEGTEAAARVRDQFPDVKAAWFKRED